MKQFLIHDAIFDLFPESVYGVVLADNMNNRYADGLPYRKLLRKAETESLKHIPLEPLSQNPVVAEWRAAYGKFKTKKGARASIEALLKRVSKGENIGSINPLVDIYNAVSLTYGVPAGAEDRDAFQGDLRLCIADGGEPFSLIGSEENDPPLPGEIVYRDDGGAVCRCFNWRDARRTMITEDSRKAFIIMEMVNGSRIAVLEQALSELESLIRAHLGAETARHILNRENRSLVIDA
ncbi:MAG: hypothetical protein LBC88_07425 [Spirochaetaceae bacterium]|jgi:DNA/RNA-binding domain of Phe-tRNA-synthetase-like protein|nr:hypothetical protein [Spirochaetaceae bacterium]